jgi:hypothetical protein
MVASDGGTKKGHLQEAGRGPCRGGERSQRAHDRQVPQQILPLQIKMFYSNNFGKRSFAATDTKVILLRQLRQCHGSMTFLTVWVRIRICGTMPRTSGSGPGFGSGYCCFVIDLQDANKTNLGFYAFCLLILMLHSHNFQRQKSKRNRKTRIIKVSQ